MGCTSSAPNMADIQANTTDESKDNINLETENEKIKENQRHVNANNELNNISVLPTCDILDDNIHLARNNSSLNISNQQVENVAQEKSTFENDTSSGIETIETENKFTTLKDVVEQVILDNILEDVHSTVSIPDEKTSADDILKAVPAEEITEPEQDDIAEIEHVEEDEHIEESVSPSQSECSRATRWEALADIAAELPASLAVDPLTGQIYSLTK